jgi:beta-glucosidase
LSHDGNASVTFRIANIGQRAGAEVAQLYVGEENPRVARPIKELKGFAKVYLRPGESKQLTIKLNQRSLAFYNVQARAWEADPGAYAISVGASSQDIRLTGRLINPSLSMIPVSDSEPVAEFESDD